ncbi:unnamed protein product [Dibothriocephalus latus]|uniref:Transmembrane protein n=1 Tax=Dibothriocephalus latus TaxID=60516 RepID=A0A3P6TI97_DIBLA|nr:unnamed protein product [Dibothriocephalus latus]
MAVESGAKSCSFNVIIFGVLLVSSLTAASAAIIQTPHPNQHASQPSREKMGVSEVPPSQEHSNLQQLIESGQVNSARPMESGMQNAVDETSHNKSHPSSTPTADVTGDVSLSDSDVQPMRAEDTYAENKHSRQHAPVKKPEAENADFNGNKTRKAGRSTGSDDLTVPTVRRNMDAVRAENSTRRVRRAASSLQEHVWPFGIIPYEIAPVFLGEYIAFFRKLPKMQKENGKTVYTFEFAG